MFDFITTHWDSIAFAILFLLFLLLLVKKGAKKQVMKFYSI